MNAVSVAWRVFFAGLFVALCVFGVVAWLVGWINPRGILIKPAVRDLWEPFATSCPSTGQ